jgi:hypothetical protein
MLISGEYDLILDGIHENILRLQYYDPVMQKTVSSFTNIIFCGCLSVLDFGCEPRYLLFHNLCCVSFTIKVKCLDNLEVSDIVHRYSMRTQQMSLQGKKILWSEVIKPKKGISHDFLFTIFSLSATNCSSGTWSSSSNWETNYWMAKVFPKVYLYSSQTIVRYSLIVYHCTSIMNQQIPHNIIGEAGHTAFMAQQNLTIHLKAFIC